jgi:transposase
VLKDRPLGIQPLYVREEEQIEGMTRLLMIGLRVLSREWAALLEGNAWTA